MKSSFFAEHQADSFCKPPSMQPDPRLAIESGLSPRDRLVKTTPSEEMDGNSLVEERMQLMLILQNPTVPIASWCIVNDSIARNDGRVWPLYAGRIEAR